MLHFPKSDEETNSSTSGMTWEWVRFQQMFIFGRTVPLILKSAQLNIQCTCLQSRKHASKSLDYCHTSGVNDSDY